MEGKKFKEWLIETDKMPSTANAYLSGVNTVSNHYGKEVLEISDMDELTRLYQLYGPQGEHARIGSSNSNNVQNGLKQWLDYQKQLAQQSGVEATEGVVDRSHSPALNQIFYGPPGTGKTYATIDAALEILDPEYLSANSGHREALKARFDKLSTDGQIRFVTFHQSFSYEDFVEGLRAVSDDEDKQLQYKVEPGVFKRLCDDARTQGVQSETGIRSNPRIWKISINGSGNSPTKSYCLDHGEARIGWGKTGDLRQDPEQNPYYQKLGSGDKGTLSYFAGEMVVGDILLCIHSADQIGAVGVVTSDYRYEESASTSVIADYQHVRSVRWLYRDVKQSILPLNDNRQFTLKTVYAMGRFGWADLLSYLEKQGVKPQERSITTGTELKPHVLIIDEINRGNVSRIFGELITLIEPSKREGAKEALSVELPYSKRPFNVPANVYLIGTMNTADRSLAGLDIALRRRFNFREMPPRPTLLDGLTLQGVSIGQLLRVMNQRIEVLLDRDHCLGHAYFMSLKAGDSLERLELIFRNQILPLLQEYFFEDWQRIQWVLNDHRKVAADRFVYQSQQNVQSLFGADVNVSAHNLPWTINEAAFQRVSAYAGIIEAHSKVEKTIEELEGEVA
jgi:5-methylcytosine-specific restriction protein B